MKGIRDYIRECNEFEDIFVTEGIDIDPVKKTVRLTNDHSKGIDFNDPVCDVIKSNDGSLTIDVYSVFKRTKLGSVPERDGNPFIYALKEKNGWKFDVTDEEAFKFLRMFVNNCKKLKDTKNKYNFGDYDLIIMCPSASKVNERFIKLLSKIINTDRVIDLFHKLSIEDADDSLDRDKLKEYCDKNNLSVYSVYKKIEDAYKKMKDEDNFEAKYIPKKYLQFFTETVDVSNKYDIFELYNMIYGKRILVLDDIVSSGATLLNTVDVINSYGPEKIDCITLLSKI